MVVAVAELEGGLVLRCPRCGAPLWLSRGEVMRAFCKDCGFAIASKAFLEIRGSRWTHRIRNPLIIGQIAMVGGRPMRFAVIYNSGPTLVLAVKKIVVEHLSYPRACSWGCAFCPVWREHKRCEPMARGVKTIKRWFYAVVLGFEDVLWNDSSIIDVICSAQRPHGLPTWLLRILGIAPICPECGGWRTYPTEQVGVYRCDECGAIFNWQGPARARGARQVERRR